MNNIHLFKNISTTKDGGCMLKDYFDDSFDEIEHHKIFIDYVKNLIWEQAKFKYNDGLSLFACDLDFEEQKIFLSRLLDPDEYYFIKSSNFLLREEIKKRESQMQKYIDQYIYYIEPDYYENIRNAANEFGWE